MEHSLKGDSEHSYCVLRTQQAEMTNAGVTKHSDAHIIMILNTRCGGE